MSRDGFTRSRRRCVLRTSSLRRSRKFALSCPTTPVSMLTRIEMLHAFSSVTRLPSISSGGSQRPLFFFHPNRRTALHMVGTEILSPCSLSHSSQWRFRLAPSFSASCIHRAQRSSVVATEGLRPGGRGGPISPVGLLSLTYLSRVGIAMPKVLTTSCLGMPRSTAASTFSLSSSGYPFMASPGSRAPPRVRCALHGRGPVPPPLLGRPPALLARAWPALCRHAGRRCHLAPP